jgi:hypothetical protein
MTGGVKDDMGVGCFWAGGAQAALATARTMAAHAAMRVVFLLVFM